ncbi:hypothetical protein HDU96_009629 [Phlyctochytrium bullatum]|nr:hypothetical protein HDU96_009629 [Phlyctochytrium bullatum]
MSLNVSLSGQPVGFDTLSERDAYCNAPSTASDPCCLLLSADIPNVPFLPSNPLLTAAANNLDSTSPLPTQTSTDNGDSSSGNASSSNVVVVAASASAAAALAVGVAVALVVARACGCWKRRERQAGDAAAAEAGKASPGRRWLRGGFGKKGNGGQGATDEESGVDRGIRTLEGRVGPSLLNTSSLNSTELQAAAHGTKVKMPEAVVTRGEARRDPDAVSIDSSVGPRKDVGPEDPIAMDEEIPNVLRPKAEDGAAPEALLDDTIVAPMSVVDSVAAVTTSEQVIPEEAPVEAKDLISPTTPKHSPTTPTSSNDGGSSSNGIPTTNSGSAKQGASSLLNRTLSLRENAAADKRASSTRSPNSRSSIVLPKRTSSIITDGVAYNIAAAVAASPAGHAVEPSQPDVAAAAEPVVVGAALLTSGASEGDKAGEEDDTVPADPSRREQRRKKSASGNGWLLAKAPSLAKLVEASPSSSLDMSPEDAAKLTSPENRGSTESQASGLGLRRRATAAATAAKREPTSSLRRFSTGAFTLPNFLRMQGRGEAAAPPASLAGRGQRSRRGQEPPTHITEQAPVPADPVATTTSRALAEPHPLDPTPIHLRSRSAPTDGPASVPAAEPDAAALLARTLSRTSSRTSLPRSQLGPRHRPRSQSAGSARPSRRASGSTFSEALLGARSMSPEMMIDGGGGDSRPASPAMPPVPAIPSAYRHLQQRRSSMAGRAPRAASPTPSVASRSTRWSFKSKASGRSPRYVLEPVSVPALPGFHLAIVTEGFDAWEGDEIDLVPGDVVQVHKVFDDGWAFGVNRNTQEHGMFPVVTLATL